LARSGVSAEVPSNPTIRLCHGGLRPPRFQIRYDFSSDLFDAKSHTSSRTTSTGWIRSGKRKGYGKESLCLMKAHNLSVDASLKNTTAFSQI
jgi:hypothetical protein